MIGMDFGFGALEADLWRLVFVMLRVGAALLAAPFFGANTVPVVVRTGVTGAIAVMICAWTPVQVPEALISLNGLLSAAGEILVGLALGFILQITFAAPVIAAELISGAMGMSMAAGHDATTGDRSTALGQYFSIVLALIFIVDVHSRDAWTASATRGTFRGSGAHRHRAPAMPSRRSGVAASCPRTFGGLHCAANPSWKPSGFDAVADRRGVARNGASATAC